MKSLKNWYYKTFHTFLIFILFGLSMLNTSCLDENMDDCGRVNIRFNYSYNMASANLFEKQADRVTLCVFDKTSRTLVFKENAEGIALTNDFGFGTNRLDAGEYIFAAWAQVPRREMDGSDFRIPDLTVGSSTLDELSYFLERNAQASNRQLANLLVGVTDAVISNTTEVQQVVVNLKKVNRTVRVVLLPYRAASGLDVEDYEITIDDAAGNGHINYDYTQLDDEAITYYPYYKANSQPASSEVLEEGEIDRAAVVEISLPRIMEENNPKLIIKDKKSNKVVMRVGLPWLLSLTSMENHKEWGLQEYLDRQDEFAITLFINNELWMQNTIIINGWIINHISIEI